MIQLGSPDLTRRLFGTRDRNLRLLRDALDVQVVARNDQVKIIGDDRAVDVASATLGRMTEEVASGRDLGEEKVRRFLDEHQRGSGGARKHPFIDHGVPVRPQTPGQAAYVEALRRSSVVFSVGPAGTGKTYLAVAMAVSFLKAGKVRRLVLVRPAVEAGEKLGFLPGDLEAKVNPYLRPLYDALGSLLGWDQIPRYQERNQIEIVPLAYMRGRTLDHSYIILDEAQNTTGMQMKMFLTRFGIGSRVVVTGDVTQIDLPEGTVSGLVEVQGILARTLGIEFVRLGPEDIVRHELVARIVEAYEAVGIRNPANTPSR